MEARWGERLADIEHGTAPLAVVAPGTFAELRRCIGSAEPAPSVSRLKVPRRVDDRVQLLIAAVMATSD